VQNIVERLVRGKVKICLVGIFCDRQHSLELRYTSIFYNMYCNW